MPRRGTKGHINKGYGRQGEKIVGGWNTGQRYGEVVRPEEIYNDPIMVYKNASCLCGWCPTCKRRIYKRIWDRKQRNGGARLPGKPKLLKPEPTNEELDIKAAQWLKEKGR